MRTFLITALVTLTALQLQAQIRIDSAFAFGPDTAKKYSIYVPSSYSASSANALMVGFHPYDPFRWNAQSWCDTLTAFSEANDLILICPDGDSLGLITDSLDYAFTTALIDSMKNWFNIDNDRIYAIGFSMGGKAVYEYGLNNAETFGGFIPIGPAIVGSSFVSSVLYKAGQRPFYLVHGSNDFPNQGFYPMITALRNNCAIVDSILLPGVGHTIDFPNRNQILTDAYKWVDSVNMNPISGTFSLTDPQNFTTITSKGFHEYMQQFKWLKSTAADSCGVLTYEVMFDVPGSNFSNPILVVPSDNNGADTTLSFTNRELDSFMVSYNVPLNGQMILDWTVRSVINNKYSDTAKSFNITFIRKKLGFDLLTPSNNNKVTLVNGGSKFFDWEDLNHYISVKNYLLFDDTAGDFSNPARIYQGSTGGASSSLNPRHDQLYYHFMFPLHKAIGDTVLLKWTAMEEDSVYSELAKSERMIYLIRGQVGMDLFAPTDKSIITSKKGNDYVFEWDSVLSPNVTYEWLFDSLGVNLMDTASIVLSSNVSGTENEVDITFEMLDSLMNFYGIEYLDTLFGQWTSRVIYDSNETYALSTYKVTIVRAHPVGIDDALNADNEILIYPNPVSENIFIDLPSAGSYQNLQILDSKGSVLFDRLIGNREKQIQLDVSELPEGNYFWRLIGTDSQKSGQFVVKR